MIDAYQDTAYDLVTVFFARWGTYQSGGWITKKVSDTLTLTAAIFPRFPPITYSWSPGIYLSDSTAVMPRCWAPVQTTYYATVTDRLGCSNLEYIYYIQIKPNGIETNSLQNGLRFPNPVRAKSVFACDAAWNGASMTVFSASGQLVYNTVLQDGTSPFMNAHFRTGHYFFSLRQHSGQLLNGSFLFEAN